MMYASFSDDCRVSFRGGMKNKKPEAKADLPSGEETISSRVEQKKSRNAWQLAQTSFTRPFDAKAKRNCIGQSRHWHGRHWLQDFRWVSHLLLKGW
jgi:hypothetical protein